MMKLFTCIDSINLKAEHKFTLFRIVLVLLSAVLGLLMWLLIHSRILSAPDYMICFIGYPAIAAWIVSVLYCYNHTFHDGAHSL